MKQWFCRGSLFDPILPAVESEVSQLPGQPTYLWLQHQRCLGTIGNVLPSLMASLCRSRQTLWSSDLYTIPIGYNTPWMSVRLLLYCFIFLASPSIFCLTYQARRLGMWPKRMPVTEARMTILRSRSMSVARIPLLPVQTSFNQAKIGTYIPYFAKPCYLWVLMKKRILSACQTTG